jgi:exopolysaccharide biosynthesis polyprenyl glycosylphosphotransferase
MMPREALAAQRTKSSFLVKAPTARTVALPLADIAGLTAALFVSGAAVLPGAGYAAAVLGILTVGGQHRLRICLRVSDRADRVLIATALPLLVLLAWLPAGRAIALVLWATGLVFAGRLVACTTLRAAHRRGLLTEAALIVGAGTFGAYVADLLRDHPELGLRPRGFLDDGPRRRDLALPTLGRPADLADVVAGMHIRRVIISFSTECRDEDLVEVMRASQSLRADVCVVPRLYELGMAVPRGCLDEIWGIPLVPLRRSGRSRTGRAAKRAFDVAAASLLLAVSAPLLLALAAVVRLRSGHAPLFRQARVTGNGRIVPILKLRTLTAHDDHDTRWTATTEHRGRLGRWLRTSHVDELPQLVNVIRGEMSLVGPRPERPYFAERFSREISRYDGRTRMHAGMTGWAQVNGLNGDTSIFERARFDNYYVEYWSVWLDLVILARTVAVVAAVAFRPSRARQAGARQAGARQAGATQAAAGQAGDDQAGGPGS